MGIGISPKPGHPQNALKEFSAIASRRSRSASARATRRDDAGLAATRVVRITTTPGIATRDGQRQPRRLLDLEIGDIQATDQRTGTQRVKLAGLERPIPHCNTTVVMSNAPAGLRRTAHVGR